MSKHISVLLEESIQSMLIRENGIYIDATLGGGGHSLEILSNIHRGTLIACDVDKKAIERFRKRLTKLGFAEEGTSSLATFTNNGKRVVVSRSNFVGIPAVLLKLGISQVDGILADLGWSTDQLENIAGLSYQKTDADLDMRMDSTLKTTAADLLNGLPQQSLEQLFREYADIGGKELQTLTKAIMETRSDKPFEKVGELVELLNTKNRNSKAKVFQALRIAVNTEYETLRTFLQQSIDVLAPGRRLNVISFHSGEEKIIDTYIEHTDSARCIQKIQPAIEELKKNIAARSAVLTVIEKI